jgi:hypothetical protein
MRKSLTKTAHKTESRTPARLMRLLTLEEDMCGITLRLVGDFLVADDNGDCGGVNVTFDGVYRRKKG